MRRRNATRGLSVIEVLISFTILAVAILALLGILPLAGRQGASTNLQNQGLYVAEQKMDEVLQAGAFIAASPVGSPDKPLPDEPSLQRTWSGVPDPNGDPNLQKITVTVTWLEQGRVRRVELVSLLAR